MANSKHNGRKKKQKCAIRISQTTFPLDYREATSEFLRAYLTCVLTELDGNVTEASRALCVSRRTLQLQTTKLDIDVAAIRNGK
ncbi:MAG: hypothetical protein KDB65_10500 [Calditrichaeota bacterium]|nr:hypothetical protein [Calditrichota bacterium]MCB9367657.1 hypothetical protein [Calditrichota bacterium]